MTDSNRRYQGGQGTVSKLLLVGFFGFTLIQKFVVVAQLRAHPLTQPDAGLDTTAYAELARRVVAGDWGLGPGLYYVSPLYIYFLSAVLAITESAELLDRQPQIKRSVRLRNPYVDPMNALQVELLRRHRAGDTAARRPLLPYAALVLEHIVREAEPREVVFSALGVREGLLYSLLDAEERKKEEAARAQLAELIEVCIAKNVGHVVLAGGVPSQASIGRLKEAKRKVICFAPALVIAKRLGDTLGLDPQFYPSDI